MEVDTDDDVLRVLSQGGSMDYEQWPSMLPRLLSRLERIIDEEFPKPKIPQDAPLPASQVTTQDTTSSLPSTQASTASVDKENTTPNNRTATLPPQILVLINSITSTLTSLFSKNPPHTIQRLAELLLNPREHYRSLPSYLHALDRVVHVSSGANVFPLPAAIPDPTAAASVLSNGKLPGGADPLSISWGNPAIAGGLGSDESLGGALLTPISWLTKTNGTHSPLEGEVKTESTEMVDGPNGPGGVETVSVSVNGISSHREVKEGAIEDTAAALRAEGGVTQGELLRQEQKAGVVPVHQLKDEEDELPHARGPEEVGMEDLGPQESSSSQSRGPNVALHGINVEAAVGRRAEVPHDEENKKVEDESDVEMGDGSKTPKRGAEDEESSPEKRLKEEVKKDDEEKEDKDVVLADVDGKTEDEAKIGDKGENKGADAVDTSSIP